jgi:phosphatidylinositol-3-phosphatase
MGCGESQVPGPGRVGRRARCIVAACGLLLVAGAPACARAQVPRLGRVFVIVGENTSAGQITRRHAPFLTRTLRPRGAWLTNYHSFPSSSSLGEYVAMVSGQYTRCEAHNALPAHCVQDAPSLFSQLAATGRMWRDWQESMPAPCTRVDTGRPSRHNEYTAHHNPAIYFTGLRATCAAGDPSMGGTGSKDTRAFDAALARGDVGDLNLVVPNDCENGHDPCGGDPVRHFDRFLAREVPRIQASPAFGTNGLIVITWDEGGDPPHEPGQVLTVLLGPHVKPGMTSAARYDHYSLERTLADGFGVAPLAHAQAAHAFSGVWR